MLSIDWLNPILYESTIHRKTVFFVLVVDKHIINLWYKNGKAQY